MWRGVVVVRQCFPVPVFPVSCLTSGYVRCGSIVALAGDVADGIIVASHDITVVYILTESASPLFVPDGRASLSLLTSEDYLNHSRCVAHLPPHHTSGACAGAVCVQYAVVEIHSEWCFFSFPGWLHMARSARCGSCIASESAFIMHLAHRTMFLFQVSVLCGRSYACSSNPPTSSCQASPATTEL